MILQPVQGHNTLVKDEETGAILNLHARSRKEQKQAIRERNRNLENKIKKIENDMQEIKFMLNKIVEGNE